jgi:hypothetical protein
VSPIILFPLAFALVVATSSLPTSTAPHPAAMAPTPFFAMSYGFRDLSPAEQTAWLAAAGYDGIAVHVWNDELFVRLEQTFASPPVARGVLRVFGVYFPYNLTNTAHRPLASRILRLGRCGSPSKPPAPPTTPSWPSSAI